jgi:hypothetical protein
MISPEPSLIWFLRLTALVLLAAALAVVMPHGWMSEIHAAVGLGALPDIPMVEYLTRSLSALYVAVGAWCWFVTRDIRNHLSLLRSSVPVTAVFAGTLIAIDFTSEMPLGWTLIEGTFVVGWVLAFWWLVKRVAYSHSDNKNPASH